MRLKEHGAAEAGFRGEHSRVEAFKMAGLQDSFLCLGEAKEFVRLVEASGEWFFNEQVEAGIKQRRCHGVVMYGGHGDGGGVKMQVCAEQVAYGCKNGDAVLRFNLRRACRIRLQGGDKLNARSGLLQFAVDAEMVAPEGSAARYGDAQFAQAGDLRLPCLRQP